MDGALPRQESIYILFFFFNDTATTEIYTLSLHDALPISCPTRRWPASRRTRATTSWEVIPAGLSQTSTPSTAAGASLPGQGAGRVAGHRLDHGGHGRLRVELGGEAGRELVAAAAEAGGDAAHVGGALGAQRDLPCAVRLLLEDRGDV